MESEFEGYVPIDIDDAIEDEAELMMELFGNDECEIDGTEHGSALQPFERNPSPARTNVVDSVPVGESFV